VTKGTGYRGTSNCFHDWEKENIMKGNEKIKGSLAFIVKHARLTIEFELL